MPVTPVARQIACGERKSNFGRCGVGRGDGAWWFLEGFSHNGKNKAKARRFYHKTTVDLVGSTPT